MSPQRIAILLACLGAPIVFAQGTADPGAALYRRDHILQVEIQMPAQDWRTVRLSHRTGGELGFPTPADDGYEYRRADVRIDGIALGSVGVRKKGFIGSVVSTRPSLKIKFDEYVQGQSFSGVDGLTLNNNNQDQTLVQTFLAYDLFARAGVAASRANFAHVRVNGEDLGIYTNVEPVGRTFLRRAFGNSDGVLYESYAGDFDPAGVSQIFEKSGARNQDRTRLTELRDVLAAPGPLSIARVDSLVDLDSFIRMWAAESLMSHWDSYTGNRNNFYVYVNPATHKMHFVPWGPDSIFLDPGPLQTKVVPKSFKAQGLLARRLWESPEVRTRYQAVMRTLLAGPWTESRMRSDITSLQRMLQPQSVIFPEAARDNNEQVEAFIANRRIEVEAELRGPAPTWPPETAESLAPKPFTLNGTFTAPWSAAPPTNPLASGAATMDLRIAGGPSVVFSQLGSFATTNTQLGTGIPPIRTGYQSVAVTGLAGDEVWQLVLTIDPFRFEAQEAPLPVDLYAVWAVLLRIDPTGKTPPRRSLWRTVGEVRLQEFGARATGSVRGTFTLRGGVTP
jgi:hypothetical protein